MQLVSFYGSVTKADITCMHYVMCYPKRVRKRNAWYLIHVCVMITDGLIVYHVNIEFRQMICNLV